MAMAIAAVMVLLFVAPAVFATDYTVGDSTGWDTGLVYSEWTSGKTFVVGDKLIFNYASNHGVDEVSKSNYDNCGTGSPIKTYTGGSTTITLSKTGPIYFLCPTLGHCGQGMKLAVTVSAGGSTTPTTPATPTTPSPPTETPSGGSPTTPTTPGGTTPEPPTTTTPPPPSAATSSNNMNFLMIGATLVLAPVFAFMG